VTSAGALLGAVALMASALGAPVVGVPLGVGALLLGVQGRAAVGRGGTAAVLLGAAALAVAPLVLLRSG
jgi:hypothetical protein